MPEIVFRGKVYNNEFEMPADVRQAYQEQQKQENFPEKSSVRKKPLTEIVDMSPEVKELYERALGKAEEKLSSQPLNELPNTDDIYRQSAPQDMQHLPSDESVYQPSKPIIDPGKAAIEPEPGLGLTRFAASIVWALILVAIAFVIVRFVL